MKFDYHGSTFRIEFERKYKIVEVMRNGEVHKVRSWYPYTTARVIENNLETPASIKYEATVGCAPNDKFSNAAGRLAALRKLSEKIQTKEFRKAVWEAYGNRGKQPEGKK